MKHCVKQSRAGPRAETGMEKNGARPWDNAEFDGSASVLVSVYAFLWEFSHIGMER